MKKQTLILILAVLFFSCKKNENTNSANESIEKTQPKKDFFSIEIDAIVKKDDSFHVFYTEDGSTNFTEVNSIWCEFKGSENSQKITFNFPENVFPTLVRIDFGVNKDQEKIVFNNLKFSYLGNERLMNWTEFNTHFWPNKPITIVSNETQTIENVKNSPYFGPSFYPQASLKPILENLGN